MFIPTRWKSSGRRESVISTQGGMTFPRLQAELLEEWSNSCWTRKEDLPGLLQPSSSWANPPLSSSWRTTTSRPSTRERSRGWSPTTKLTESGLRGGLWGSMGEAQADVWPTKNVWAIVKEKVKESEPVYKEALRKVIIKCWREINADNSLLARLMFSIPRRLQAVISNDGNQIRPNEY